MNKILHINIGGSPFSIDENAYSILDNYLHSLNMHFSKSESSKEIMQDIESRIRELLGEKLQNRSIVSIEIIESVISTMGTPKDFGADANDSYQSSEDSDWGTHTGKKLFRDPNNKKVAGVCSGLSHYFGIEDPIWLRIIFLLGLTAGGSSLIIYIVLWVLVKPAKSASDFLQMKGKPININNIASKVEEKFSKLTDQLENLIEKTQRKSN
ncbi:MAG: PspC domain-containing protein [Saprospiraceae bacterium]